MVIFVIIGNNITSLVPRENIFQAFFILFHSNSFTGASFFREVLSSLLHLSKAVFGKQSQLSLTCCVIISAALKWLSLLGISVAISFTTVRWAVWAKNEGSIWFENQSYVKEYYVSRNSFVTFRAGQKVNLRQYIKSDFGLFWVPDVLWRSNFDTESKGQPPQQKLFINLLE